MSISRKNSLDYSRRLHYPWEYKRFFGPAQVYRVGECTIFRIANTLGHFRLGITIKSRGSSIERNIVKRTLREFFRTHSEDLGSHDYNVVIPSNKKMAFPYGKRLQGALERDFLTQLKKQPAVING